MVLPFEAVYVIDLSDMNLHIHGDLFINTNFFFVLYMENRLETLLRKQWLDRRFHPTRKPKICSLCSRYSEMLLTIHLQNLVMNRQNETTIDILSGEIQHIETEIESYI